MSRFTRCPNENCRKKGFYEVHGYDPNPEKGPLWRCKYCNHHERRVLTPLEGRLQPWEDGGQLVWGGDTRYGRNEPVTGRQHLLEADTAFVFVNQLLRILQQCNRVGRQGRFVVEVSPWLWREPAEHHKGEPIFHVEVKDNDWDHYPCNMRMMLSWDSKLGAFDSPQSPNRGSFARKGWRAFAEEIVGHDVRPYSDCGNKKGGRHH